MSQADLLLDLLCTSIIFIVISIVVIITIVSLVTLLHVVLIAAMTTKIFHAVETARAVFLRTREGLPSLVAGN